MRSRRSLKVSHTQTNSQATFYGYSYIFWKLEKASYNIFFIRAVMMKSLYTLPLSSGYNDLLNSRAANEYSSLGVRGDLGLYSSPF